MNQIWRLQAINEAIWLRDNADKISYGDLINRIRDLSEYGYFSNRQITKIIANRISHVTLGKHVIKMDKSGGRLEPSTLEDIREVLFSKHRKHVDYEAVLRAIEGGTSQNMISKLTGVDQSLISRKVSNGIQ